jgi:glutathione S-transferase
MRLPMKLFYSPGACSLSPHIVLRETGLPFELEKVDLRSKQTESGADFMAINPKGYVPALKLDDGSVLTEGPAIVQYLADRAPARMLAPANGTIERYHLQSWLNFIGTEVHKQFSPLFNPQITPEARANVVAALNRRFDLIDKALIDVPYLTGAEFTVADAYLFTVMNWSGLHKIDLTRWPALQQFQARVATRPAVQGALKSEGLIK